MTNIIDYFMFMCLVLVCERREMSPDKENPLICNSMKLSLYSSLLNNALRLYVPHFTRSLAIFTVATSYLKC